MVATFQQHWSAAVDAIACQVLARGSLIRKSGYLDLTGVEGAWLYGRIGRSDATALACTAGMPGVSFFAHPVGVSDQVNHPDGMYERLSGITAAVVGRINFEAGYVAQTTTMVVDGTSLVPAASVEAMLFFWGTATDPTGLADGASLANAEWAKWSKGSATSLTVRQPMQYARIDNEYITTQADVFPRLWLPGGTRYDVGFDYSDDTAGSNVAVHAFYETLDYVEKVTV
jgi:hypothetical protein